MLNKAMFIGRLGADPVSKCTPDGTPVCEFTIAVDESYKDKNGDKIQKTEWVAIVTWRKLAEICGEYLSKGKLVYIEGSLETRSWEDKEGVKHIKTKIKASDMKMLDRKKDEADGVPLDDVPF